MECTKNGTEQHINTSPTSKPKPPVARKPTKPVPPKKPTLASKPTHLISSLLPVNGELESAPQSPTTKPAGPTQPANQQPVQPKSTNQQPVQAQPTNQQPVPPQPQSQPANQKPAPNPQPANQPAVQPAPRPTALSSPQSPSPRPSNPPPPLPTSSPKGRGLSKTPPPLPKTPPRGGSVKSHSRKPLTAQVSFDADSTASSPSEPSQGSPAKTFPSPSKASSNICDKPDSTVETDKNTADDNSLKENKSEIVNLKSNVGGSTERLASKPLPKVPLKPRPRIGDRKQSLNEQNEDSIKLNIQSKVNETSKCGNSTFFTGDEGGNVKNDTHESKDDTSETAVPSKLEKQESVQYFKAHSPAHSPRLPRKPPPRTPNKPSKVFLSKDSVQDTSPVKHGKTDNVVSSSCDNEVNKGTQNVEPFQDKNELNKSLDNDSVTQCKTPDNRNSLDEVDSPAPYPRPIPRRSTTRPRPAPRKRQSLNRLSGTEETLSGQYMSGSVHNLSDGSGQRDSGNTLSNIKAKSEDSVFLASQGFSLTSTEIDINSNVDDTSGTGESAKKSEQVNSSYKKTEGGSKVTSLVKSRVVFSKQGEQKQYRIIDKTIVKSHVTDIDPGNTPDSVVLRQKDSIELEDKTTDINSTKDLPNKQQEINTKVNGDKCAKKTPGDTKVQGEGKASQHTSKSSGSDGDGGLKDSFEDLLSDKSILEPTSLLNEIEEILSRSYKHSSLTRSGSSPEKACIPSPLDRTSARCERSRSVDVTSTSMPIRPPRPKKEQKRLRSRSQVVYDSCGSDTESLPDLTRSREDLRSNCSLTLPPAKPHPPKPKRNKLLKVQRSHSDVTAMKSVMDKQIDRTKSPAHKRQFSDAGPSPGAGSPGRHTSLRRDRPSRKAPPPPGIPPFKVNPPSPVNINTVVPVTNKTADQKKRHSRDRENLRQMKQKGALKDTAGSVYSCINDEDVDSDDDHDYHYISDDAENYETVETNKSTTGMVKVEPEHQARPKRSPPKLPPRNMNNSHSFETSSLSSASHDFDSAITEGASSIDDLSVSSGCIEPENGIHLGSAADSPGFKALKHYPKTSSPNVRHRLVPDSDGSSDQSGMGYGSKGRPVSGASFMSDDGSVNMNDTPLSSSESEGEYEDKATRKREKKLNMIAQEIMTSERVFVDVLLLLNVDFRKHISAATEAQGRPVIPNETLNRILDYLPQLQNFNEDLLKDLEDRVQHWEKKKQIADIFVKKGPFLKLYSSYIRDFETMTSTLDEAIKKYPAFQTALKEFEMSDRCAQLALKHYMLKPIQRIPQYRMLLSDYIKYMLPDSGEMKDMQTALAIVSEVAHHANENMRHGDYVQKMLEIQRSLIGQFEVIKPGRIFLKEGELMKQSRKEMQPRHFFMFNDVLLYTTPVATGYRLNNVLPLAGMKVSVPPQDEYKTEFNIISVQRSFTLHAGAIEEREDWVTALNAAIEENALKRNTFEAVRAGAQVLLDKDFVLGHKAPLWIPDARVTMCMQCTCEFTVTWRRHHCRACGRVVCGNCSDNKASLRYLKYKSARVCDECHRTLQKDGNKVEPLPAKNHAAKDVPDEGNLMDHLSGLFERFQKIRKSGRTDKKPGMVRPERLKEVNANDEGASMSGYLHRLHKGKKWKRHWYLIKEKVLYTFKATQDTAATQSMVLLGYEVSRFTEYFEGIEPELLFQLSHQNTDPIVFRTDSATATERWVTVMRDSIVA